MKVSQLISKSQKVKNRNDVKKLASLFPTTIKEISFNRNGQKLLDEGVTEIEGQKVEAGKSYKQKGRLIFQTEKFLKHAYKNGGKERLIEVVKSICVHHITMCNKYPHLKMENFEKEEEIKEEDIVKT